MRRIRDEPRDGDRQQFLGFKIGHASVSFCTHELQPRDGDRQQFLGFKIGHASVSFCTHELRKVALEPVHRFRGTGVVRKMLIVDVVFIGDAERPGAAR